MSLATREAREALSDPPAALRYRCFHQGDSTLVVASALGGLLIIQEVGVAVTREDALSFYNDAAIFDKRYGEAVGIAIDFTGQEIADLSFSFVWHAVDGPAEIEWQYVRLPASERPVLIEATLVWCLAEVVDAAIRRLPLERAVGQIDRAFIAHALDLFALGQPQQVWTSLAEIEQLDRFYRAWKLGKRIEESRGRFDQAATSFSFFWEAAERRRETTLTLTLGVVAVVGLLQADQQLHRLIDINVRTVDLTIVSVALVLIVSIVWRAAVAPRRAGVTARRRWRRLAERMQRP